MFISQRAKICLLLTLVFSVAFFLRIYGYEHSFRSSDNAIHSFYAIKLLFYSLFDLNLKDNLLSQVYAYPYGFNAFIIYLWNLMIGYFNIPLSEVIQSLPLILFSSLTVIGAYLLVKILTRNDTISLYSAAFIAVGYFHVIESRLLERMQMILPLCFLFFLFYFLLLYNEEKKKIFGYLTSVFMALFMVTSNKFIAIIPLLLFSSFVLNTGYNLRGRIKNTLSFIFKKELLLIPAIVFLPYVLIHVYYSVLIKDPKAGFIGKMIGKPKVFDFYFADCFLYIKENFGTILTLLLAIGLIYGIKKLIQLSRESILLAWSFIFIFPFLFLSPPYSTVISANVIESDVPLLILTLIALWRAYLHLKTKNILIGRAIEILSVMALIFMFLISWGMITNSKFHREFPGSQISGTYISTDNGAKASGYIVRENIDSHKNIFTNYEPILAQYYFGRDKIFCQYDATEEENLKYLEEVISRADYIVLNNMDRKLYIYANILKLNRFKTIIELQSNNETIATIFSKTDLDSPPVKTDIKILNVQFDKKYANRYNLMIHKLKFPPENRPAI